MYAVIFRAITNELDKEYFKMAKRMRELAINQYNCLEFTAITEKYSEIAISYWDNESDILKWKKDSEHLIAQELGKSRWYKSYSVEIVEIKRQYTK